MIKIGGVTKSNINFHTLLKSGHLTDIKEEVKNVDKTKTVAATTTIVTTGAIPAATNTVERNIYEKTIAKKNFLMLNTNNTKATTASLRIITADEDIKLPYTIDKAIATTEISVSTKESTDINDGNREFYSGKEFNLGKLNNNISTTSIIVTTHTKIADKGRNN